MNEGNGRVGERGGWREEVDEMDGRTWQEGKARIRHIEIYIDSGVVSLTGQLYVPRNLSCSSSPSSSGGLGLWSAVELRDDGGGVGRLDRGR